jgi:flagellar biosynthesis/type III secretory pathway protein FliH
MCEFIEKFREEGRSEGLREGLTRGMTQGITQGRQLSKISTIRKMYIKNMNFNQISDVLDDDNEVKIIYDIIVNAPDKDDEWVYNRLVEAEK